jgi:hypothetical protein
MLHFVSSGTMIAAACTALVFAASTIHAGVIVGGWNYAIDSQNDGSGGAEGFEYRALAFQELGGRDYFAISSGMPINGINWSGALNNNVGHGDLFINFSSHNLDSAAKYNDPNVFAVRFDSTNDSLNNVGTSNTTIGLFKNVTVTSLTTQNDGYSSLQQYYNSGFGRSVGAMGDLSSTTDVINYFGNGTMYPTMKSGTKIGDISLLTRSDLNLLGLNFGQFGADPAGNNVFGFSFSESLVPEEKFTADLFFECMNDGVAIQGLNALDDVTIQAINAPEPGSLVLWAIAGTCLAAWAQRRRRATRLQVSSSARLLVPAE